MRLYFESLSGKVCVHNVNMSCPRAKYSVNISGKEGCAKDERNMQTVHANYYLKVFFPNFPVSSKSAVFTDITVPSIQLYKLYRQQITAVV